MLLVDYDVHSTINIMLKIRLLLLISIASAILLLQACSNGGFHLRKETDLPKKYQHIQIKNISSNSKLIQSFEDVLEESGGELVAKATTQISINHFRESKHSIAYSSERKVREFLLSLKFDYVVTFTGSTKKIRDRIKLDRVSIYDANFALGKAQEERQIRQSLYDEAARLMLLKIQYSKD